MAHRQKKLFFTKGILWGFAVFFYDTAYSQGISPHKKSVRTHGEIIQEHDIVPTQNILGTVISLNSGAIPSKIEGQIHKIPVLVGDFLNKGDLIATVDPEKLNLQLIQAQSKHSAQNAALQGKKALFNHAQNELNRLNRLKKSNAFNASKYEDALEKVNNQHAQVTQALHQLALAKAEMDLARLNLTNGTITAPYNGFVIEKHAYMGEYISAGAPLIQLVDLSSQEIEARIPQEFIPFLHKGDVIKIENLIKNEHYWGSIRSILPHTHTTTQTQKIRIVLASQDLPSLTHNETVNLKIPKQTQKKMLLVPKDAILVSTPNVFVFTNREHEAHKKKVRLGIAYEDYYEVLNGLEPGDLVITRGNERLNENDILETQIIPPRSFQAPPPQKASIPL